METSMKTNRRLGKVLTYTVLILGSIVMIFPFVWMVLTCFKTQAESMAVPPQILPSHWDLENFVTALQSLPFVNLYINTALLIVLRVICAVVFSSMAGYAFAKLNFPCKNLLFSIVAGADDAAQPDLYHAPVPDAGAHGADQHHLCAGVSRHRVGLWHLLPAQTYLGIPNEIAEAAYLDGCTKWQTFTKVMFPLTGSSCAALAIFTAVFAYSDLMWPLICNTDLNMMTLSAGLSTLNGQYSTNFPVLMAGSLLAMIPMVVLYLLFQKQFIQGIAMTGGK